MRAAPVIVVGSNPGGSVTPWSIEAMTAARSVVWTTLSGSADSHVFVSTARSDARFRRAVRHRGHFPNEQAAMKVLYLVANRKRPNRPDLIGKINGWKEILNALTIHYGERLAAV